MATSTKRRVTSFAPQFQVDDLPRPIAYYEKPGSAFAEPGEGFHALAETRWGTKDFYIEDPDGCVIVVGGRPAAP